MRHIYHIKNKTISLKNEYFTDIRYCKRESDIIFVFTKIQDHEIQVVRELIKNTSLEHNLSMKPSVSHLCAIDTYFQFSDLSSLFTCLLQPNISVGFT